jgi:hypothetical protein
MKNLNGIIVIVGNYGSGKTQVTLNLAIEKKLVGEDVAVADLDLINPYFRIRESVKNLSDIGIKLILPDEKYLNADLPILSPAVAGIIRKPAPVTLLDAGGEDVGAIVLSALADHLKDKKIEVLMVVNLFRPFTSDIKGALNMKDKIEAASRLKITGIVSNANLMDETEIEHIKSGYDFAKSLSKKSNTRLDFITAPYFLYDKLDHGNFSCPVLKIRKPKRI